MAALSSACYVRQQPGQPFKTLNVTNAILRTDKTASSSSSYRPQCTAKRKSAVELLQETKSLYVKSETVLDRKQELRRSLRSSGSSDKGSSSHDIASGHYKGNCCNWSNGGGITCLPPPKSPRLVAGCQRKSTADSQQLQNDLRRLLNADSKENLFEATSVFLDDVIVPPPIQYRRSVSHGQQQHHHHHHHHQPCGCGQSSSSSSSVCHKSLPDLTDVASAVVPETKTVVVDPVGRCCRRSASSGSVLEDDGDVDDDDDIFDTLRGVPSPNGFGNKSRPDETDASVNATSFPDSLSLTSYKTDARWQQSAHGETGSSIEEERDDHDGNVSPRSSVKSNGRRRRLQTVAGTTCGRQQRSPPPPRPPPPLLPPPPPLPPPAVATRRHQLPVDTVAAAEFKGKPILRSKSDVGHRAPNLLSLLPAAAVTTVSEDRRDHDDPEQLENFFGNLGLDPEEYKSIVKNDSETGSQVCFGDSNSSVGSVSGGGSNGGGNGVNVNGGSNNAEGFCVGGGRKSGGSSSSVELPSIVERNARIIKWLWNCRKANNTPVTPPPIPSPSA